MMFYRRKQVGSQTLRLLFASALLFFGILLPFISTVLSPPTKSNAAIGLPTAYVRQPTDVAFVVPQPIIRPVAALPPTATFVVPTQLPAIAVPVASIEPTRWLPTPTYTPQPLPSIAAAPIATLFPTLAPELQAAPALPSQPGRIPPILMYHYVRWVDPTSDALGFNLSVSPDDFAQQMAWLHDQGYAGIRMDAVDGCLRGVAACPPKAVALTFDDGYEDAYTSALPILQQYGMSATFYIITNFVGQPGYMTWAQIAALRDAGMQIGSHTLDHLDLRMLDPYEMQRQVAQSKIDLEAKLTIPITSFCYPAGFYDAAVEDAVRAAGYANATTTRWDDDTSDILALPRRRVAGGTPLDGFIGIVQAA